MTDQNLKYYNSNQNLKGAAQQIGFTEDNVIEYLKCVDDPVYFIDTYCKIVTLDHGVQPFKLYDCQINKLKVIHENRKVLLMESRQSGKCFSRKTRINIKNKTTGELFNVTAEEFHNMCKMP